MSCYDGLLLLCSVILLCCDVLSSCDGFLFVLNVHLQLNVNLFLIMKWYILHNIQCLFLMTLCVFVFMEYAYFLIPRFFSNHYDIRLMIYARCKHLYVTCKLRNDDNDDVVILSCSPGKWTTLNKTSKNIGLPNLLNSFAEANVNNVDICKI